jgi:hypothetical protein
MRTAHGRFTIRKMMLAIAVTAVLFGAMVETPRLWILRHHYLGLAEKYDYWATRINGSAGIRQEITYYSTSQPRGPEPSRDRLARMEAEASYYAALRDKYERAARRPWLAVAPDPPPP